MCVGVGGGGRRRFQNEVPSSTLLQFPKYSDLNWSFEDDNM